MLTEARHANASFTCNGVSHNRLNFCSVFRIISDCWSLLDSTAPVLKLYISVALAMLASKVEIKCIRDLTLMLTLSGSEACIEEKST